MFNSKIIKYLKDIGIFISTITIKSTWYVDDMNRRVEERGGYVDPNDPETWKFYLNIQGMYHPSDTPIYINSVETGELILFDTATLAIWTKTRTAYAPGRSLYKELLTAYPDREDFIKCVLTPYTGDIQDAIDAPNWSLLSYNTDYIEIYEEDYIVRDLLATLDYVRSVVYGKWLSRVEEHYERTIYSLVWHYLFASVMRTRVNNLKTSRVHTFYLWEYLAGKGIGDYSNVLSRRKALWLYRNIDYIEDNQGSNHTLQLLGENLLDASSITLVGKLLRQQIPINNDAPTVSIPEIESFQILEGRPIHKDLPASLITTYLEFQDLGVYPDVELDPEELNRQFSATSHGRLPTKLIELQTTPRQDKYSERAWRIILDNWLADTLKGRYLVSGFNEQISFGDGLQIMLSGKDALNALYYIESVRRGITPTNTPWITGINTLIFKDGPYEIQDTYSWNANTQYTTRVDEFITVLRNKDYSSGGPFKTPQDYMLDMYNRVAGDVLLYNIYRNDSDGTHRKLMRQVWGSIFDTSEYSNGAPESYVDWFSSEPDIHQVIDRILERSSKEIDAATSLIMETFLPITGSGLERYIRIGTNEDVYRRLKELFISLCSYTVLFQDTPGRDATWVQIADPLLTTVGIDRTSTTYIDGGVFDMIDGHQYQHLTSAWLDLKASTEHHKESTQDLYVPTIENPEVHTRTRDVRFFIPPIMKDTL